MAKRTERILVCEFNQLLPLPPILPPLTSPFPIGLTNGGVLNLATLEACIKNDCEVVLLSAVINWSATFTPPSSVSSSSLLNTPGHANVTFEFLTNGVVVYRVTQTAVQNGFPLNQPTVLFSSAATTYEIASMLFLDTTPICCNRHQKLTIFTLRASNITLIPPQFSTSGATTTAAVGAVTFVLNIKER
jgi:hypothetical protein